MARLRTFAPLLLALPLLLAGCDQVRELVGGSKNDAPARASGRAVRVTTVELTPQTVEIERELTGRTTAYRWAEVRPEVSGILKELCFTEGAMVKEGDVLYRIEPDTYKAALNKARADLASAEANLKVTRLRERRTADMLRGKSVSQQDYDDVKASLQQAQATVQSCAAAVETAEINYRRTEVRAPISGRITISNFTVGALLTANQTSPLATIYQTDPMYVELSQSSDDLYALKKQMGEDVDVENINPSLIRATLTMADGQFLFIGRPSELHGSRRESEYQYHHAPRRVPQPGGRTAPRPVCERQGHYGTGSPGHSGSPESCSARPPGKALCVPGQGRQG